MHGWDCGQINIVLSSVKLAQFYCYRVKIYLLKTLNLILPASIAVGKWEAIRIYIYSSIQENDVSLNAEFIILSKGHSQMYRKNCLINEVWNMKVYYLLKLK